MKKYGKKYQEVLKLIEPKKEYELSEAIELVKKTSVTKFESGVNLSMCLNIDTKQADQQVRGTVILPNGNGKQVKVCCITNKADEAKEAGADFAGGKELLEKIVGGWFEFDILCASPEMMGEIGKLGRVLGPKGLMPNPKIGTVSIDVKKMVSELKAGKVEYRADKEGNINMLFGKVGFDNEKLIENFNTIVNQIIKVRPAAVKGTYIKSLSVHTTMGPSVKIVVNQ
ncbi:MAG: 50S ribosomal protein L1 [Bacillales bacterium]